MREDHLEEIAPPEEGQLGVTVHEEYCTSTEI